MPLSVGDPGGEIRQFDLGPPTHSRALQNLSLNLISVKFSKLNLRSYSLGSLPQILQLPPMSSGWICSPANQEVSHLGMALDSKRIVGSQGGFPLSEALGLEWVLMLLCGALVVPASIAGGRSAQRRCLLGDFCIVYILFCT